MTLVHAAVAQQGSSPTVEVKAPSPLADLIAKNLDLSRSGAGSLDAGDRLRMVRQSREQAASLLETEGYFTPVIEAAFDDSGSRLKISVDPGRRTEVTGVDLEFRGDLAQPGAERTQRVQALRDAWTLKPGLPFRQRDWTQAKQSVLQKLLARDYAAAGIAESAAEIDPEHASAKLKVVFDSGPVFTLGKLEISGLDSYSSDLVTRYSTLKIGEPYDQDRLLAFQNALQNSPYFSSVSVEIERDPARSNDVPVRVLVHESKPKRVGFGAGYSSNTGARAEVTFNHANFLDRAWHLATGLRVDQKGGFGFADIYLPPTAIDYRDSFGVLAERSDIQGLVTRRAAVGATRTRTRGRIETQLSLNLQGEKTAAEGGTTGSTKALTLNYSWTYRNVDNLLDPRSGYVLNLQVGGATKALLSDQNFVRSYARYQHYFPIGKDDSIIVRGELGYTAAKSRDGIPQDFVFRTGGAQSVRGYDYQSLGVHDGDAVVGARKLTVASAEYVHWFSPKWGGAAFYDVGNAWDTLDRAPLFSGYGLGGRWRSPAGPLALDLAYGHHDRKFRIHFAVAIAF